MTILFGRKFYICVDQTDSSSVALSGSLSDYVLEISHTWGITIGVFVFGRDSDLQVFNSVENKN